MSKRTINSEMMNRLIFLDQLISHDGTISRFSEEVVEAFKHINCVGKILTTVTDEEAKKVFLITFKILTNF